MSKYLLQSGAAFVITKWGKLYYKVGQLAIYKYFSYYKVGQVLLQSGAGITNWGIITKWCITAVSTRSVCADRPVSIMPFRLSCIFEVQS